MDIDVNVAEGYGTYDMVMLNVLVYRLLDMVPCVGNRNFRKFPLIRNLCTLGKYNDLWRQGHFNSRGNTYILPQCLHL